MTTEELETLAEALNEEFGSYPWEGGADKAVWRLRAERVTERLSR